MLILQQFVSDPGPCAYLPQHVSRLEYSIAPVLAPEEYEALMNQGHRKFGMAFFRPVCAHCAECRPIRFSVERFKPDRSQRRCFAENAALDVRVSAPVCDDERLELFSLYHEEQRERKLWPAQPEGPEEYEFSFVRNQIPAAEIAVYAHGKLAGVLLAELTPTVISAVYHYYDPALRARGLGTFLILQCVELARELGRPWIYLGYYVRGCQSMAYKTRFRPCELMDAAGDWRPLAEQDTQPRTPTRAVR
jgi:arginine-tRNA-protein transferase